MKYTDCPLYGIQSKKMLKYVLHIKNGDLLRQDCVVSMISPYIDKTKKPRLIEPPQAELKTVQKRIKTLLGKIEVPDNVFSGIKDRSYIDNACLHLGERRRNLYKIDLTAFFPSISRETVYRFFFKDLCCSPDVSKILTNLTTVDLRKLNQTALTEVFDFLNDCLIHLFDPIVRTIFFCIVDCKLFI